MAWNVLQIGYAFSVYCAAFSNPFLTGQKHPLGMFDALSQNQYCIGKKINISWESVERFWIIYTNISCVDFKHILYRRQGLGMALNATVPSPLVLLTLYTAWLFHIYLLDNRTPICAFCCCYRTNRIEEKKYDCLALASLIFSSVWKIQSWFFYGTPMCKALLLEILHVDISQSS